MKTISKELLKSWIRISSSSSFYVTIQPFFTKMWTNTVPIKLRKAPIKIEPKVYFANERTFLTWMHSATVLSAAAIGIIAFANDNPWSQVYGVMLLPVSLGFIIYAMIQCESGCSSTLSVILIDLRIALIFSTIITHVLVWRRVEMLQKRLPGPYIDEYGPVILTIMLMISISGNFFIKLYSVLSRGAWKVVPLHNPKNCSRMNYC